MAYLLGMDTNTLLNRAAPTGSAMAELCPPCTGPVGAGGGAVPVRVLSQIANVGDFHPIGEKTMNAIINEVEVALSPVETALNNLVKNDGKTGVAAFDYMLTALPLATSLDAADSLIVAICDKVGARGKPTKQFPKGKANPNAIKGAGYSMTAECARLVRKVGKALDEGNVDVQLIVDGTLGVIPSETLIEEALAGSKSYAKAMESGDEARIERAKAAVISATLDAYYGDKRCDSFAALRRQLDKGTASKAETTDESADGGSADGEEGETVSVSAAAAVVDAEAMAIALVAKVGEVSDEALAVLLDAIRAEADRRAAAETVAAAA